MLSLEDPRQANLDFPWDGAQVSTVDDSALGAMGKWALSMSFLWVQLPNPGPEIRGRLGLFIEQAIEEALAARGAVSATLRASSGMDAALSDQLYRARLIEQRGIALGIPRLEAIANRGRTLDAEDSAVLRWWMAAAADRPVRMVIAESNQSLRVYPSPVLFESLFDAAPQPVTPRPPSTTMAESAEAMELSDLPPRVELKTEAPRASVQSQAKLERAAQVDAEAEETEEADFFSADLPDLDAALGLTPEPMQSSNDSAADAAETSPPSAEVEPEESAAADEGTVVEEPALETVQPALQASAAEEPAEASAPSAPNEPARGLPRKRQQLALGYDEPTESKPQPTETSQVELDADEFLRTLQEDSQKPAPVEILEEPAAANEQLGGLSQAALARLKLLKGGASASALPAPESRESEEASAEVQVAADLGEDEVSDEEATEIDAVAPVVDARAAESSEQPPIIEAAPRQSASEQPPIIEAAPRQSISEQPPIIEAAPRQSAGEQPPIIEAASAHPPIVAEEKHPEEVLEAPSDEDPFDALARNEWRAWARNLDNARGPRPLSVVERHFVTDYTRLGEALRRNIADESAADVMRAWGQDFQKSYSEAFDALRVRGKRPTMVLDMPEAAARLARLQGARRVQLVLVDSLRFDLGLMVQDRMRAQVDAALTERLLLWSALPTTTTYQLQLLAKGADGLKEPGTIDESPALVARGAAADAPRRIRAGRLELFKIDAVADSLSQAGQPIAQRLPEIADRAASVLADHFSKQPPRTLICVFGDHGFRLDPKQAGTTCEVQSGGATPEEVLVPAFAWLTGAVH